MSLDQREKSLISIGVSVGVNCQPCLEYCVTQAKELGITREEIQSAIEVGKIVRRGAASRMDRYSDELVTGEAAEKKETKGCGCSCS